MKKDMIDFEKKEYTGQDIIIYGSGIWGKIAYYGLLGLGISTDNVFFYDMNFSGLVVCGKKVRHPTEFKHDKKSIALVCVGRRINSVYMFLRENEIENIYYIKTLIENADFEMLKDEWDIYEKYLMVERYMISVDAFLGNYTKDHFSLVHVGQILTDRCNLKCKYCNQFVPQMHSQWEADVSVVINATSKVLECVDSVASMHVQGGEIFLHKKMNEVVKWACKQEKIKTIEVLTNATIVPSGENLECLRDKKVHVTLDDYGVLSSKIDELQDFFDKEKIAWRRTKSTVWFDLNKVKFMNQGIDEIKQKFAECVCQENLCFFDGDKMVRCVTPHRYYSLGLLNEFPDDDYIDFSDSKMTMDDLREKMFNLIYNCDYIKACNYCYGTGLGSIRIPVAEQIS